MSKERNDRDMRRIERALDKVAMLIATGETIYAPIFERLEAELASLRATDPRAKARLIIGMAKGNMAGAA